ncbi:hypothetical protein L2E82_15193 [Cichorium intybus]|uniref:Uncharacterized protein n=1 Tax=Cichorium intybus TaxID=13427 RepID=A0ACB9F2J8_CICIN|nr:hypothetical protein L2E82_15193 [Cichorium intybus]
MFLRISSTPVSSSSISLKSTVYLGAIGVGFGGNFAENLMLNENALEDKNHDCFDKKKAQSAIMMEGTSKQEKRKATKERIELEQEYGHRRNNAVKMAKRIKLPEQQISDAEKHEMEKKLKELQYEINVAKSDCQRLKKIEDDAAKKLANARDGLKEITSEEGSG